jgi:hypothetical protein
MKTRRLLLTIPVVVLSLLVVLCGCEHKPDHPMENERPSVKVSGGPPNGGVANYTIPIYWYGWDADGVVDHFLYAIDDTSQWTETRFFQGSFLFVADTARGTGEFGRWHTFYVKSVDDDGFASWPDYLVFDARTVAPKTTIRSPKCDESAQLCLGALPLGTSVKVVWRGDDLDSRDPKKEPVAYMWRLFNTSLLNPGFGVEDDSLLLNIPDGTIDTTSRWSEPTPQTEIQLSNLAAGVFWQFGLRAIDEAGAIEPGLKMNQNVIFFKTMPNYGSPDLTLYEGASAHIFPSEGQVWERQAATGKPIVFRWEGDASRYGGTISGYMWGYDIEDLSDPEQWEIGWSGEITSATLLFDSPGIHYFYVKVKDYADAEQLAIVELEIVSFLFDRLVLYVDDFYDITPSDLVHDTFMNRALTCARALEDTVYHYNCWLPGQGGVPAEMIQMRQYPALSELSRYRFIIWDTDATSNSFNAGIEGVIQHGILDVYLKGGGNLWIYGREIVRGTDPSPLGFKYGNVPDGLSFAARFIKISGIVNRPIITTSNQGDGFRGAWPNRALSDMIPSLDSLDYSKGGTSTVYGMQKIEGIMSAMQDPQLNQRPDTLYFYKANYSTSLYHKKACSLRFHDLFSGSKVVYMGFPIHYFFESKVESLACYVTNWVFEDIAPTQQVAGWR